MRILVLGGTGGVGRHVLRQAVARGHAVVALARPASAVDAPPEVTVLRDDPLREGAIASAIAGCEGVISCLGPRRRHVWNPWSPIVGPTDVASRSARLVVAAAREAGARRVVAVSAAGVADSAPTMNAVMRFLVATSSIGVAYRDLAEMERIYAGSGLEVCCPRPVALTNGRPTGRVREVDHFGLTMTIPRADVARFLLDRVEGPIAVTCPQIAGAS